MKDVLLKKTLLAFCFIISLLFIGSPKATSQEGFVGEIRMFAGNFAPRGWAFCDGQLLLITEYTALFSILGTTYGGDGRTNFALPDLRGRAPIQAGQGPGLSYYPLGARTGRETISLTTLNLPSHSHLAQLEDATTNVNIKASSSTGTSSVPGQGGATTIAATGTGRTGGPELYNTENPDVELNTGSRQATINGTINVSNTGGSLPVSNVQPVIAIHYIICLNGIYPSRN
ncbi:phage tail protein [Marinilabilia rubra]|uniref:Phage tail protein n=1 Tax=Marinilabilia rubra TaxID=2162893 RepID=A0A2U2BCA2_9BACT|nr:tail fiber protein [Marinilabilia rubra]PWE00692.1 phage tail protein [Marinilabilia rubra]